MTTQLLISQLFQIFEDMLIESKTVGYKSLIEKQASRKISIKNVPDSSGVATSAVSSFVATASSFFSSFIGVAKI